MTESSSYLFPDWPPIHHHFNLQRTFSGDKTTTVPPHKMTSWNPKATDFDIFPPSNHENLNVSSQAHQDLQTPFSLSHASSSDSPFSPSPSSISSLSFSPSDEDEPELPSPSDSKVTAGGKENGGLGSRGNRWLVLGFDVLWSKILGLLFGCRNRVWSLGGIGVLVVWGYIRVWMWWRRKRRRERVDGLMRIITEKDEKISQLLHQIAQMNEVLLSKHKALSSKLAN